MKTEEKIEEAYLRKIKSVPNVVLSPEEIKLSFAKIVNRIDLPEQNKGKTKRINFYNILFDRIGFFNGSIWLSCF